jgi:hypothetical protein
LQPSLKVDIASCPCHCGRTAGPGPGLVTEGFLSPTCSAVSGFEYWVLAVSCDSGCGRDQGKKPVHLSVLAHGDFLRPRGRRQEVSLGFHSRVAVCLGAPSPFAGS